MSSGSGKSHPYHCHYNPIKLIWDQIKFFLECWYQDTDSQRRGKHFLWNMEKLCETCREVVRGLWKRNSQDNIKEPSIINLLDSGTEEDADEGSTSYDFD